jgi:mono/diheme cytochrome c family protein
VILHSIDVRIWDKTVAKSVAMQSGSGRSVGYIDILFQLGSRSIQFQTTDRWFTEGIIMNAKFIKQAPARNGAVRAMRLTAIALALGGAGSAFAADAANGKILYNDDTRGTQADSCASCHNANPASNKKKVLNGANNATTIQSAIAAGTGGMDEFKGAFTTAEVQDIAAYLGTCSTATLTCTAVVAAPQIAVSASAVTFASTALTTVSAAQTLTISNAGTAALTLTSIALSGANATDFTQGGTCSTATTVPAGGSCTVTVGFKPTATGSRTATLTVASAVGNVTTTLTGTATAAPAAIAAVSSSSLSFGAVVVGSVATSQSVTVSNSGTAPLSFSAIATGTTEFPVSGGTCSTSSTVAAGGSCTVGVGFLPAAAGARSGTLTIANNGSGSPLTVALSGSGTALSPVAQVAPSALSFSQTVGLATAAQTVTVSNTGTAPLTLSSVALSGAAAADYALDSASTCAAGTSVAVNNNCVIKLVFTPSATGARAATLTVAHNAAGSPGTVALSGTGNAVPQGTLTLNQSALTFASTALGASSSQSVTLGNNGTAALTLSGLSLGGANAGEFSVGGNCTAGAQIAVGSTCTATIGFAPAVVGARAGTLTITTSNSTNPSATLSLSGTAVAAAAPAATVSSSTVDLGSTTVGQTSSAKTFTLQNTGNAALTISGVTVSPATFAQTNTCGSSLAAGASCTVSATYTPTAAGAATGAVTITSNAASSPTKVSLTASGVAVAVPVLNWTPAVSALTFADTNVGVAAATQTLTLSNAGPGSATLTQVQKAGANAADFTITGSTCSNGGALAAGSTCTVGVAFQPSAAGARTATLSVTSNASGPNAVTLSGNGVAVAAPALSVAPAAINLIPAKSGKFMQAQSLTLSNTGTGSLKINSIVGTSPLWVLSRTNPEGGNCARPPFTLAAGKSCSVKVTALVSAAPISAKVTVSSGDSGATTVVPVTSSARPVKAGCTGTAAILSRRCGEDD